jgi:uncharacterized membrane-anchored protein
MTRRQALGLWGGLALVLVVVNVAAARKERVLARGEVVLLELRPIDPRSLMQGDYMRLALAITDDLRHDDQPSGGDGDGALVLRRDENGVGRYVRGAEPDELLAPGELRLRYRRRGYDIEAGPTAYFFPEGQGARFSGARFAEVRLAASGEAVLIRLRDRDRRPLE